MFTPRPAHWALLLLAGLSTPGRAAADPLRHEMAAAAAEIRERLQTVPEGKRSVTLASFTCPTSLNVTGGARARLLLTEELGKVGVVVKEDAALAVSGTLRLAPGNQPAAQIVPDSTGRWRRPASGRADRSAGLRREGAARPVRAIRRAAGRRQANARIAGHPAHPFPGSPGDPGDDPARAVS